MSNIGFDDLLQQAEQLTTGLDGGNELPRVQRNLQQLLDAGQRLCSKSSSVQDNNQIKAELLLSGQGQDVPKISERLKALKSQTLEPLETVCDTDIEGYLRNERENAILAVVEEQKQSTFDNVEKRHWQSRLSEWEEEKQQILNKLIGGDSSLNFTQELSAHLATSYMSANEKMPVNPRSRMDVAELGYARQVHIYNEECINQGNLPDLGSMCQDAAEKLKNDNLVAMWKMVNTVTKARLTMSSSNIATKRKSQESLHSLTNQLRSYLELSYMEYMQTIVHAKPHLSQLGGSLGTVNLVKSFLKVQTPNPNQPYDDCDIDGLPLWSVIFYCLRCGDLEAVIEIVKHHEHIIPEFSAWIQDYAQDGKRKLSSVSANKMKIQYKRHVHASSDPFKIAVYCVIGHCDVNMIHSTIASRTEDYLWFKLSQVVFEEASARQSDILTLFRLQTLLVDEYGESHFNASQNPILYFQVLFLTCQFEAAIEFLSRFESFRSHATHVALVLHSHQLLLTSSDLHSKMITKEPRDDSNLTIIQRINLPRLILLYTKRFELTDPREALNYFYFLRDIRSDGQSLFFFCTSEMVRDSGEFEMLLGGLNPDGSRRPGAIDKYCGGDTKQLIAKIAADTESRGLHEDAIHLYDLCRNHDQTLSLMNRLLCQVVSNSDSTHPDRLRLKNMATSIAERYRQNGVEVSSDLRSTFHLLLDLLSFFDLYHGNQVEQGLEVVSELQIIPNTVEQVQGKITEFKLFSDEIRQNIADILLATMDLLARRCRQQKELSRYNLSETGDTICSSARRQARAIIIFGGMLPYHLPGDTTARLVQLEIQMN